MRISWLNTLARKLSWGWGQNLEVESIHFRLLLLSLIESSELGVLMDTGHCALNQEVFADCVRHMAGCGYVFHIHDD